MNNNKKMKHPHVDMSYFAYGNRDAFSLKFKPHENKAVKVSSTYIKK